MLAQAAGFEEVPLQAAQVLVEQVIGLVQEADGDVGQRFGGAGFRPFPIGLEGGIGFVAKAADVEGLAGILLPLAVAAGAEEVAVVDEQFLQAGAGDIGEFDLTFAGGDGGLAALGDVLFPGPGGLHHLVDGAVALREKSPAEMEGEIVDDLGFAVGEQVLVVSLLREEGVVGHGGEGEG